MGSPQRARREHRGTQRKDRQRAVARAVSAAASHASANHPEVTVGGALLSRSDRPARADGPTVRHAQRRVLSVHLCVLCGDHRDVRPGDATTTSTTPFTPIPGDAGKGPFANDPGLRWVLGCWFTTESTEGPQRDTEETDNRAMAPAASAATSHSSADHPEGPGGGALLSRSDRPASADGPTFDVTSGESLSVHLCVLCGEDGTCAPAKAEALSSPGATDRPEPTGLPSTCPAESPSLCTSVSSVVTTGTCASARARQRGAGPFAAALRTP